MIGFSQDLKQYKRESTEGKDTENLSKNELYELVNEIYMVPPVNSKGVTREYLLKVRDGSVFRVTLIDYKQFEFNLDKAHSKKIAVINNALLVKKLNILLKEREQPELGFNEFDLPEQNWLFKVARYIDRTNLLEIFLSAPYPEPPLDQNSSAISKIYYGRLYASEWLFRLEKAKKNKKLWDGFEALAEKHRTLQSFRVNVEVLEHELKSTKEKVTCLEHELNDMIGRLAMTYTQLEDPKITPELILAGGSSFTPEMQKLVNTNAQLYSILNVVFIMSIVLILFLTNITS